MTEIRELTIDELDGVSGGGGFTTNVGGLVHSPSISPVSHPNGTTWDPNPQLGTDYSGDSAGGGGGGGYKGDDNYHRPN